MPGPQRNMEIWKSYGTKWSWPDLGEMGRSGVDWIGLAEDRDQWCALVNVAMKHRIP
jgi:hypothetical protein